MQETPDTVILSPRATAWQQFMPDAKRRISRSVKRDFQEKLVFLIMIKQDAALDPSQAQDDGG